MNTLKRCLVSLSLPLAALAIAAGPAHAERVHFHDRVGDARVVHGATTLVPGGLDITRVSVDNRSHAVSTTVTFDKNVSGVLYVVLDPRHGKSVVLASRHHEGGRTRNYVRSVAFTGGDVTFSRLQCEGFRVTWNHKSATAKLWMPATCLNDGRYGAVRIGVATEDIRPAHRGPEVDIAPNAPADGARRGVLEWKRWIERG